MDNNQAQQNLNESEFVQPCMVGYLKTHILLLKTHITW